MILTSSMVKKPDKDTSCSCEPEGKYIFFVKYVALSLTFLDFLQKLLPQIKLDST